MHRPITPLRLTLPILFLSLLLAGLGTTAALSLVRQQRETSRLLAEDVDRRRAARMLENALSDLIAQLRGGGGEEVEATRSRVRTLIAEARGRAVSAEERRLVAVIDESFGRFEHAWAALPGPGRGAGGPAVEPASAILRRESWPASDALRDEVAVRIEDSVAEHRAVLRGMAWRLAGVGLLGSLAGLMFGFVAARGLGRTIRQINIQLRQAADTLGQAPPTFVLEGVGLRRMPDQVGALVAEIERVVGRLHQREREVLRSEQMAAVGQVAAGVAHELRNPLTSIMLLVQAHREAASAGGLPGEDLALIESEIRRMDRHLQAFLDFARPSRPERHRLDAAEEVGRTLALVGGRAHAQGVDLRFDPPPGPVPIEADAAQLQQLLVNLALNALDAMPGGGALRVDLVRARDGRVELLMSDTGPGIDPALLPRIFEPFVTGKPTGVGLGLAISRRIAEDHGGDLLAVNRPDGGACLILNLPGPSPAAPPGAGR